MVARTCKQASGILLPVSLVKYVAIRRCASHSIAQLYLPVYHLLSIAAFRGLLGITNHNRDPYPNPNADPKPNPNSNRTAVLWQKEASDIQTILRKTGKRSGH